MRSLGQPPLQEASTSHSRQTRGSAARLASAELPQAGIGCQVRQRPVPEVPDEVLGVHEVVAHVESAVVLQDSDVSARLAVNAQRMRDPVDRAQRFVEVPG